MKNAALITGATGRIGLEIAKYLAKQGTDIIISYNNSGDKVKSVQKEIESYNVSFHAIKADFNKYQDYQNLISESFIKLPHLNILVNNASIFEDSSYSQTDEKMFDEYINIHFKAPFFLTKEFAAKLIDKGSVINITDSFITKQSDRFFTYLITKKMLAEFTRSAAATLGPKVRVNAVAPGSVLPALNFDENFLKQQAAKIPLKVNPTTEDIVKAVDILLKSTLTGQTLFVDGGAHLK